MQPSTSARDRASEPDSAFMRALDQAPRPIASVDREHRYAYSNPAMARLLGASPAQVEGRTHAELGLAEQLAALDQQLETVFASGALSAFDLSLGGARHWVELVPSPGGAASPSMVFLYAHELPARDRAQNAPGPDPTGEEFLDRLSHAVRNPLMPIRSSLYVLERATPGGEQARRAINVIQRQVTELTRLVDDLLDVARVARSELKLERERIEARSLVEAIVEAQRPGFAERGLELEPQLALEPLLISGDPARVRQIANTLLETAARLLRRGGCVRVGLGREGTSAVLRVGFRGATLSPAAVAQLLAPFAPTGDAPDAGVLGLELVVARELAELQGGMLTVSSDGGAGSGELALRWPLLVVPPGALLPAPETGAARKVLVIEDNRDSATSLREALELMGYEVAIAEDGPQGLLVAGSFRPDVVICDIGLPGMDGYAVARAFRSDERLNEAVLVALTGHALPEDQRKAVEAGFTHHMAKPLRFETLERLLA